MTERIYRKVDPNLWDDEKIADLDPIVKLVWLYVLTGEHTRSLPGLSKVGTGELAEGIRLDFATVDAALSTLESIGRLERDQKRRLLRVPRAPFYNPPDNANVVRSWFKQWDGMPDCDLKRAHLDSLRSAVVGAKTIAAWNSTFGFAAPGSIIGNADSATYGNSVAKESRKSSEAVAKESRNGSDSFGTLSPNGSAKVSSVPALLDLDPSSGSGSSLHTHSASARDAGPTPAPMSPDAERILAELRTHPALQAVTTVRLAEELAGRAMASGRPVESVCQAIREAARDVGAEAASGHHAPAATIARTVAKYADKARVGDRDTKPANTQLRQAQTPKHQACARPTGPSDYHLDALRAEVARDDGNTYWRDHFASQGWSLDVAS